MNRKRKKNYATCIKEEIIANNSENFKMQKNWRNKYENQNKFLK